MQLRNLVFATILIRAICAMTYSHWFHADEWCQTIEPAQLIAHGFGFHSQEVGLHLRNLTWPLAIAQVLKFTHWLSPQSIDLRVFGVNFLCGLLDLLIFWGWVQLLRLESFSKSAKNWSLVLLLAPWFTLYGSINPRSEHLSEIALWVALGCFARRWWVATGVASVAIFAFRYPSILFSVGLGTLFLHRAYVKRTFSELGRFLIGVSAGLVIFGAADAWFLGRPWESFWMYLQYNIFTGSGTQTFGRQSAEVYSELFLWNWTTYRILIPLGFSLFVFSWVGIWEGLRKTQPWAICLILYGVGHLLVPHKEGRFMAPIETLSRWSAFVGGVSVLKSSISYWAKIKPKWQKQHRIFGIFRTFGVASKILWVFAIFNAFLFLHHLRGDLWKDAGTYRELGTLLKENPQTCGIVTSRFLSSILLPLAPTEARGVTAISPPAASFRTDDAHLSYFSTTDSTLAWQEKAPLCRPEHTLLLHADRAENEWSTKEGCELLGSGVLKWIPKASWEMAISKRWIRGAWYRCPPSLLKHFKKQKTEHLYSESFGRMESLPRLGISAKELEQLGKSTSPPPADAVFPQGT